MSATNKNKNLSEMDSHHTNQCFLSCIQNAADEYFTETTKCSFKPQNKSKPRENTMNKNKKKKLKNKNRSGLKIKFMQMKDYIACTLMKFQTERNGSERSFFFTIKWNCRHEKSRSKRTITTTSRKKWCKKSFLVYCTC